MPRVREDSHSMSVFETMDIKQTRHADLRFPPGHKLRARFGHLIAQPQASPLMLGNSIHVADAGWLAATGSASADAATVNAADISNHSHSQGAESSVGPVSNDRDVLTIASENQVFSTRGQKAPEQPGRSAKTRSRPFRIPR